MIMTVKPYAPPVPPQRTGNFRQDTDAAIQYLYATLWPYESGWLKDFANAFNGGPQGLGADIASARTRVNRANASHFRSTVRRTRCPDSCSSRRPHGSRAEGGSIARAFHPASPRRSIVPMFFSKISSASGKASTA